MSAGPSKGSVAAILLLLFTGCGPAALQVCVCLGMGMGANCSHLLGPRSHTCKVAGSLGKGTRCLAFADTHRAMTGPDSEERNRLFSRFVMGHKSRIGQCSEPVCVPDIASTGTGNSVWKPRYYYRGQLQPFSSSDL